MPEKFASGREATFHQSGGLTWNGFKDVFGKKQFNMKNNKYLYLWYKRFFFKYLNICQSVNINKNDKPRLMCNENQTYI